MNTLKFTSKVVKNKKSDLAINIILTVVIVLVSILFLLALFSKNLSGFSRVIYCKTAFYIHSSIFVPESYRQDPEFCKYSLSMKTKIIKPIVSYKTRFGRIETEDFVREESDKVKEFKSEAPWVSLSYNIKFNNTLGFAFKIRQEQKERIKLMFCNKTLILNPKTKVVSINLRSKDFKECNKTENFNINISLSGKAGVVEFFEPKFYYKECNVNEELLALILSCWEEVNYGHYSKSKVCEQVILSKECEETSTSEELMTKLLVDNELCSVFPNNDFFDCGEEDSLDFRIKKIKHNKNYIIEFDKTKNKIVVS